MIAPLDLTTEEMEVYKILYSKMDFETNVVKYTLDQIVSDSNSKLLMTKKKVSLIIKNFISENLLSIIEKGSKGNPTAYKIIKITDINEKHKRTSNDTQKELKGNSNETNEASDISDLEDIEKPKRNINDTQKELKGNSKVIPIKDNKKEKENIDVINLVVNSIKIEYVKITDEQYKLLVVDYGEKIINNTILQLDGYILDGKGKKYKDHNRVLRTWLKDTPKINSSKTNSDEKLNNRPNAGAYRYV